MPPDVVASFVMAPHQPRGRLSMHIFSRKRETTFAMQIKKLCIHIQTMLTGERGFAQGFETRWAGVGDRTRQHVCIRLGCVSDGLSSPSSFAGVGSVH